MRRQWAERMQAYQNATPEQRKDMRLDRYVGMLDMTYRFSEEQKPVVRAELKKMQSEYYQSLGPVASEYEKLQDEMGQFWAKQMQAGGDMRSRRAWEDPEFRKMRERMREIEQAHPFDFQKSVQRVETLLPAEQVQAGQKRREEWSQRMREWRENRGSPGNGGGRARGRRNRPRDQAAAPTETPGATAPAGPESAEPIRSPERAPHPFEIIGRSFESKHDLNPAQTAAARGIVKQLMDREIAYKRSREADFSAAAKIPSPTERQARLKELNAPVDELTVELKARLDDLLTADQRGMP